MLNVIIISLLRNTNHLICGGHLKVPFIWSNVILILCLACIVYACVCWFSFLFFSLLCDSDFMTWSLLIVCEFIIVEFLRKYNTCLYINIVWEVRCNNIMSQFKFNFWLPQKYYPLCLTKFLMLGEHSFCTDEHIFSVTREVRNSLNILFGILKANQCFITKKSLHICK